MYDIYMFLPPVAIRLSWIIQVSEHRMLFDLQASTQLTPVGTGVEQVKNDFIVDLEEGTSASIDND